VPNDFDFPGVPAEIVVPSVNAPVYGDPFTDVEAFTGYSRRFKWGTWKVQFNIRNLFDDDDIIPQRANTSGDVTIATIPQPRTFILSTTFSY
jgi:outer membrane receptor protein involved in Fe transport